MPRPVLLAALCAALLVPTGGDAVRAQTPEPILAIDSLLSVDNEGLARLFVTLNEHAFKLVTDPDEVSHSANAFLVPRYGPITVDIADLLAPDDEDPFDDDCTLPVPNGNNCITILPQGPEGTRAQIVISDTQIAGQAIAYAVLRADLEPLPEALALMPAYPNPFRDRAILTFTVPEARTTGVPLSLTVYDVLGRRVRTLVDARHFPGTFAVTWDGLDEAGRPAASGLYVARIATPERTHAVRLTRLR